MFDGHHELLCDYAKSLFEIVEKKDRGLGDNNKGDHLRRVFKTSLENYIYVSSCTILTTPL